MWLRTLIETAELEGAVLEVGVAAGGTAALSDRLLRRLGVHKQYIGIDTFEGFLEGQWVIDEGLGTPTRKRYQYSANSRKLVRRTVDGLGAQHVELIQGDVAAIPDRYLPGRISACLIDVDLSTAVEAALRRLYERLVPGGVILVDDCREGSDWKARVGYEAFVQSQHLRAEYELGMGVIRRSLSSSS
jgi:O-methyltransferase